jgi:hypothetical protein
MSQFFGRPNVVGDDGWYIDDINIPQALASPLTLAVDTATITPIAPGVCGAITPALTATPASLSGPGQIDLLDAKASTADKCLNGVLQYLFFIDDGDGIYEGDPPDTLLRDFTDSAQLSVAPSTTTQYCAKVRCSTDPACDAGSSTSCVNVPVTCPSTATLSAASIRVSKPSLTGAAEPDQNSAVSGWGGNLNVRLVRGDLTTLRSSAGITNVATGGCLVNNGFVSSFTDNTVVAVGAPIYYLLTTPSACNVTSSGSYSMSVPKELPGAGGNRDVDIAADPDRCLP